MFPEGLVLQISPHSGPLVPTSLCPFPVVTAFVCLVPLLPHSHLFDPFLVGRGVLLWMFFFLDLLEPLVTAGLIKQDSANKMQLRRSVGPNHSVD